ncbi:hypothetical protein N431DRAFT_522781 [Stipitochalara longipes BDJ]|nr:hypothetical protein N431DRAFT_522781 [Stipitochalara longipes BDJ]
MAVDGNTGSKSRRVRAGPDELDVREGKVASCKLQFARYFGLGGQDDRRERKKGGESKSRSRVKVPYRTAFGPLSALQLASGRGQEIADGCAKPKQEPPPPDPRTALEACLATAPGPSGAGGASGVNVQEQLGLWLLFRL